MINRIYRLMDTKRIDMVQREIAFDDDLMIARPHWLAVCAADQRYYQGKRAREVMRRKLPMALIHEATATVMHDPSGRSQPGTEAVPIPLMLHGQPQVIKANYDERNEFCSSGYDGFLQDYIAAPPGGFIPVPESNMSDGESMLYVFSELVSVVFNAIEAFEKSLATEISSFGVWGDGSMGYVMSLVLRCVYPQSRIYAFGKTARRLHRFSFADDTFFIDDIPDGLRIDHCFECVGGAGSESAVSQIIELIAPQGCVSLLGVSEEGISINTRTVLDKGLKLLGSSRSSADDFRKAVELIHESPVCKRYLETLCSEVIEIRNEADIAKLFEQDILNDFKTVGKWLI